MHQSIAGTDIKAVPTLGAVAFIHSYRGCCLLRRRGWTSVSR
jgi:hypothetical protein